MQNDHPTRPKRSSAPRNVTSAVTVPLLHRTHSVTATSEPSAPQQHGVTDSRGGLGVGICQLPFLLSALQTPKSQQSPSSGWSRHERGRHKASKEPTQRNKLQVRDIADQELAASGGWKVVGKPAGRGRGRPVPPHLCNATKREAPAPTSLGYGEV